MPMVTVRYWAAAKQAAGVAEDTLPAETLAGALADVAALHGTADFEAVLARSSFLVDGEQVGAKPPGQVSLREGTLIEILPPFAGG